MSSTRSPGPMKGCPATEKLAQDLQGKSLDQIAALMRAHVQLQQLSTYDTVRRVRPR